MNPFEFELVVSVVVVAVVLDLVSIPGAHGTGCCLGASCFTCGPGAVRKCCCRGSFRDCCFNVATRTVVAYVVFAAETLSVAAVVSGPAVWVHHVWSAHRDRLLQFSSASLAFLALRVMPYAAVLLHLSAHQTLSEILPFVANTCHCFPPVPSHDDEILNRNVHF